jgi:CO dehydrogenase maturation factor
MDAKIIAVCGKGGVGKTSISALIIRQLREQKNARILAIDADPAIGFSTALGVQVGRTVDDIRNELIEAVKSGQKEDRDSILSRLDYEVFEAMAEKDGFAFLAIGRPEAEGCYCKVNNYLKDIIEGLAAQFDYVVIDGEAGIEQVNRRVMEKVTHLLLVSDASCKGTNVIKAIHRVAGSVVEYDRAGVVLNRLKNEDEVNKVDLDGLTLLGFLTEDEVIRDFDIEGRSLLGLPDGPSVKSMRKMLEAFGVFPVQE